MAEKELGQYGGIGAIDSSVRLVALRGDQNGNVGEQALRGYVDARVDASGLSDMIDVLAAAQQTSALYVATWAGLASVAGTYVGQGAFVTSDTGTHVDPVSGATVANSGTYRWTGTAWQWLRADVVAEVAARTQGVQQGRGIMPSINAANVELLGFDALGRALLTLAPSVVAALGTSLGTVGVAARTAGVEQQPAPYPGIISGGAELLGFDANGRLHANPSPDFARKVAALVDAGGGGGYNPVASGLLPKPGITCWGDSMTQGAGGDGTSVTTTLAATLGRTIYNRGIGGQNSHSIAIRAGAMPLTVTLTDDTIPASGGAIITGKNNNILTAGGFFSGTARVSIAGVPGLISTDSAGVWTFTRDTAGAATPAPPNSEAILTDTGTGFIPGPGQRRGDTVIIWAGRNDGRSTRAAITSTRDLILSIVKHLTPLTKRYLVVSVCNGGAGSDGNTNEGTGSTTYSQIAAANAELAATFGAHFVDLRSYMVKHAIYDAGLTPTANDIDDMSKDAIPDSLRFDSVHFTAVGYTQAGLFLARQIQMRGW